jgi:hypothetical protein
MGAEYIPQPGRLGFGQYPLSKWRDVPYDYLRYIVSIHCKTSIENKEKALHEMNEREKLPLFKRYW